MEGPLPPDDRSASSRRQPKAKKNGHRRIEKVYDYTDLAGNVVHQTVRYAPKGFSQRRPDGKGGYSWSLEGVEPVLYRLDDVVRAVGEGRIVFVVEGEKDADNAREQLGVSATTCSMGAGKWRPHYNTYLRGAHVVVVSHNDSAGRDHASKVATSLSGIAASVRVVELDGVPAGGGDLSDWIEAGGTRERLKALVDKTEPYASTNDGADDSANSANNANGVSDEWESRSPGRRRPRSTLSACPSSRRASSPSGWRTRPRG
jgi:hypothetical protein